MEKVDKLNWKIGTDKNNKNKKLIKKTKRKNKEIVKVIEEIKKAGV